MPHVRMTTRGFVALLAVTVGCGLAPAVASSAVDKTRKEQIRYAKESGSLSADAFAARKADFQNQGCWVGPAGCRKPFPYNTFDWSDDGCSPPTPEYLRQRFRNPCVQHDFGYRNFGKGLTLGRTESDRARIDNKFRTEMWAVCARSFSGRARTVCRAEASTMWAAVRTFNDWRER